MQAQRGGAQKQVIVTSSLLGHTERETNGKDRAKANSSTCVSSAPGTSNLCCPPTATRSAFAGPDTHGVCAKMLQNAVLARLAIRHTTCRQAQGHHDVSVLDTWHNQGKELTRLHSSEAEHHLRGCHPQSTFGIKSIHNQDAVGAWSRRCSSVETATRPAAPIPIACIDAASIPPCGQGQVG
jgi:hypothetical protein